MKSIYSAYQVRERRVIRGELDITPRKAFKRTAPREPLLAQFIDLLIHTGLKLKQRYAAGKPMAWFLMTGNTP